jgi:hypothetical protein
MFGQTKQLRPVAYCAKLRTHVPERVLLASDSATGEQQFEIWPCRELRIAEWVVGGCRRRRG